MKLIETNNLFQQIRNIKVAVVGDVMLDTYWWGAAERISPEAPVPVVTLERTEYRIGGAANVALNAISLAEKVYLLSVIGKDKEGDLLKEELSKKGIDTVGLQISEKRKTTCKTRVISRNQQMIRLDSETTDDLSKEDEHIFIASCRKILNEAKPDVLIFEDYNKGVLTEKVIKEILSICDSLNIITSVDPKQKNFFAYKGVTLFKPNLKEVREGLRYLNQEVNQHTLSEMHNLLYQQLKHQVSLITLSEKGVFYQQQGGGASVLPTYRRTIADVSGAGDTVIAVASLLYAATKNPELMATIANLAGGLVCEEVGTVPVNRERLLEECVRHNVIAHP
ncbi:MAG: bifunctional heptose 7-phosphate kinase/heptose 1-phosphate adenyltransferase [Bacteroidota bacterium]|jgi:rfaE bifunctional protein kinase chain/domain